MTALLRDGQAIQGELFSLRVHRRGEDDPHICCQLYIEDDGHWHKMGGWFSAHWLTDLYFVVSLAKDYVATCPTDSEGQHIFEVEL